MTPARFDRHDAGTRTRPRPKAGGGADVSLTELLMLPVLMAGLSLLMWFSLPIFPEALAALGPRIDERRELISRLAKEAEGLLPARSTSCRASVDPLPVFVERSAGETNMEILGASRLRDLGIDVAIPDDVDLGISGDFYYLMYWRRNLPSSRQRMTRKRIAAELERPLTFRYVLIYGDQASDRPGQGNEPLPSGSVRVSAILFDLSSAAKLCELTFEDQAPQARERLLKELASIARTS